MKNYVQHRKTYHFINLLLSMVNDSVILEERGNEKYLLSEHWGQ